jgi:hypothetical protein
LWQVGIDQVRRDDTSIAIAERIIDHNQARGRDAVILSQKPQIRSADVLAQHRRLFTWKRALPSAIAAILIALLSKTAVAVVRITDDRGGNIGAYWSRYMALRDAGEQFVIDGTCSSACTLVLGIVPHDRICVTPNAVLGFHAAWRPGLLGFEIVNDPGTRTLWNIYPLPIRQWINRHGGLGLTTIYLAGPELFTMYRQCR